MHDLLHGKESLEDYFDRDPELEEVFNREKNHKKLDLVKPYPAMFTFVRQKEMLGTGHALLQAAPFIQDEPVVVAYPDDIHFGEKPLSGQLIELYEETGCSVMAAIHNPPHIERYGVLSLDDDNFHVKGMVEKPAPGTEPSKEVSIGRYLYTPDFFKFLAEGWVNHSLGEYYHLYALQKLMDAGKVVYKPIEGERLDTGEPSGFLRAVIRYSWGLPELKQVLEEELKSLR